MSNQFEQPPEACRPIQYVSSFEEWSGPTDEAIVECFRILAKAGVGGLMVNVSFENYLRNEQAWGVLRRGVDRAHKHGLRLWIYDEKGYPSGTAGGLVLAQLPAAEAQGLIRKVDPAGEVHYEVITLYEATHATENFYEKRHYINILDQEADSTFISVTHDQYAEVLKPISEFVEAFFTDEPSLISTYIPKGKDYPRTLPWHSRLPEVFRSRKGYDLLPCRESLFRTTGEIDRKIRCDFYEVIADLCAETYFGRLQQWCRSHSVLSSGHLLGEETLVWQTLFDGDPFTCYRKFDIPGIDMILSDPERIMSQLYFLVPAVAGSAARLQGKRRVMCEISDFFGSMEGHPATLDQMRCTAGILYALGVTDLVCMYPASLRPTKDIKPTDIPPTEYRGYTDFAARLNYMFTGGKMANRVALLHPMVSLWAHFTPSNRSMYEPHPDPDVRFIDDSFTNLCRNLLQEQIDVDIVDERSLAEARIDSGALSIGEQRYTVLILPPMDTIRTGTMEKIVQFVHKGGSVFAHPLVPKYAAEGPEADNRIGAMVAEIRAAGALGGSSQDAPPLAYLVKSRVPPQCSLVPSSESILCTRLARPEGSAFFVVNVSSKGYSGKATFASILAPVILDPLTGKERKAEWGKSGDAKTWVTLVLRPFESLFILFR